MTKDKEKTKKKPIEQDAAITDYKQTEGSEREYISEMKFLADTAMDFVEFPPEKDIFQYVGEKVKEIMVMQLFMLMNLIKKKMDLLFVILEDMEKNLKKYCLS